jgi:hypothetical protein
LVSVKLFIGGLAIAAVLGGAIGTGASLLVIPRVVGPAGPAGRVGAQGLAGAPGAPGTPASRYLVTCTIDARGYYNPWSEVVTAVTPGSCFPNTPCPPTVSVGYLETNCSVHP